MTSTICTVDRCDRPTQDCLCSGCVAELVTALRELAFGPTDSRGNPTPGLAEDLQVTVARLSRTGSGTAVSGSKEPGLPFNAAASDLSWELRNTIATWARDLAETNPHLTLDVDTVPQAAEWMAQYPNLLALHPAADELFDEIANVHGRVRRMVDRAPGKVLLGRCGEVIDGVECDDDVYGRADEYGRPDERQQTVRCRTCGTEYDAWTRREWMIRHVRDMLATAAEIAMAAPTWFGQRVNPKTIRTWANRGQVATHGHNPVGIPLHRIGEVLDVATRRQQSGVHAA